MKLAYTPVLIGLALLTYAGVRFLTTGHSGFSEGIVISNGVAAGCAQGNHAARVALHDILPKSHELHPSTSTAQWVDDLAQRTQSPPSEVVNKTVEAALQLVWDLQEDKLAVASKSVFIATTPNVAKQVVSCLARHDIHIQEASQAKDLGWMCPAQESQCVGIAKRWVGKMRGLASGLRSKPVHADGEREPGPMVQRAVGAPPTWTAKRGRGLLKHAQCGGRGRCLTTTIALLHPNAGPAVQIPCNLIRQWLIFWEQNHRLRPKVGKVWATNSTAMMARSPATRWRYVRGHMSAVIVTLMQHNWSPIRHTSWKDPEGNDGASKQEVWELTTGDSGKPFERRSRGNCGRRLQGMSWEQAWRAGQISPLCSSMTSFGRKRACMQPEECCWQRPQPRVGRRSDDIVQGWWSRRSARDERKRTRTCIIEFGNAVPTQVRSLTRHSISFTKPLKPRTHWNVSGSGGYATILDFARHEVGVLASIWEWRVDRSLLIYLW